MEKYALIFGHGRSGTNWLLNILNVSPLAHCRNESDKIEGSPLYSLHKQSDLEQFWDDAIAWSAHHIGERDPALPVDKSFLHPFTFLLGLAGLISRRRVREFLSFMHKDMKEREWKLPFWVGSQDKMEHAFHIHKINQAPSWAEWVLKNRSNAYVFHIVRHPGGFLNSWKNRYLALNDPKKVWRENIERLKIVAKDDPTWAKRFGDIEGLSVEESELWFWRYSTDTINEAGKGNPNYKFIKYEDLANNTVTLSKEIYAHCNLPWDERVEKEISKLSSQSKEIAQAWKQNLDPEDLKRLNLICNNELC